MSYQLSVTLLLRSEGTTYLQRKRMGFILLCSRLSVPLPSVFKSEEKKMDYLPKDPAILVSSVNMLLRDEEFDTLESLCYAFNREPRELRNYLFSHGFVWSENQKQFRPIGYDGSSATGWEEGSAIEKEW